MRRVIGAIVGTTPAEAYNYEVFEPAPYTEAGCDGPVAGEALDEVPVWTLEGARLRLGELTDRVLVLETGSTTCPLYRGNVQRMARVANRHPEVVFVVLYTREAHPGERRGAHRDRDDKHEAARSLLEQAGEWRPVVVDDLDGSLHRRLEGAPNSVTILDGDGRVRCYLPDNDPSAVAQVLDDLSAGRSPRVTRTRFRPPNPRTALAALLTGGRDAVRDFLRGLPALLRWRISGGPSC